MTERCEPPPELRGRDGWHWVQFDPWPPRFAAWQVAPYGGLQPLWKDYERQLSCTPDWAHREWGWRYIAPVATPAEVEALKAERDAAIARDRNSSAAHATRATDLWLVTEERDNLRAGTDRLIAERTTLRAERDAAVARERNLRKLLFEARGILRGPAYLWSEQQVIASLKMGESWPEQVEAALKDPAP